MTRSARLGTALGALVLMLAAGCGGHENHTTAPAPTPTTGPRLDLPSPWHREPVASLQADLQGLPSSAALDDLRRMLAAGDVRDFVVLDLDDLNATGTLVEVPLQGTLRLMAQHLLALTRADGAVEHSSITTVRLPSGPALLAEDSVDGGRSETPATHREWLVADGDRVVELLTAFPTADRAALTADTQQLAEALSLG